MTGKVYLVGAGPGDPELLTLKALKVLKLADVVLHDELVGPAILAFVPSSAQVRNVGKRCGRKSITQEEIHALMVNHALLGLQVVRLKGGDPLIFGRGGEEIEALRKANVDFEIVPGVTAALGAAAAAQIPLTHRRVSSAVVFLTSHHASATEASDWPERISPNATLVIYMPGYDYKSTGWRLLAAGFNKTSPCAIISRATSPNQQVHWTTVEDLPFAPPLPAPTLLVVGEVVRFTDHASLRLDFALGQSEKLVAAFTPREMFVQSQRYPGNQERSG